MNPSNETHPVSIFLFSQPENLFPSILFYTEHIDINYLKCLPS